MTPPTTRRRSSLVACWCKRSRAASRRGIVAVALVGALFGCDRPHAKSAKTPPVQPPSPEALLDHVIERLEEALKTAQPFAGAGVASQRRSTVRKLPRTAERPERCVEVTIVTRVALTSVPKPKARPKDKDPIDAATQAASTINAPDPREPLVETEKFLLRFLDGRWQLDKEAESDTLRVCWDYALSTD